MELNPTEPNFDDDYDDVEAYIAEADTNVYDNDDTDNWKGRINESNV